MNSHDPGHFSTLVARGATGDMRAFEQLVRETQPLAYGLAFRMLGDGAEAEDAVQEAFLRVWNHLARFDGRSAFTTWLYTIVSRQCLDRLRARKRRGGAHDSIDDLDAGELSCESPLAGIENRELATLAATMAGRLSPTQRLVFTLRDLEDLPVGTVCEITGLSEGSVKTNLCYARRALRAMFDAHDRVRS